MDMATTKGRPRTGEQRMVKTSIALPPELIESLAKDARKSGFKHWSQQARCELMEPRGMWKIVQPYLPGQDGPSGKA